MLLAKYYQFYYQIFLLKFTFQELFLGLIIFLLFLLNKKIKIVKLEDVDEVGSFLTNNMAFFLFRQLYQSLNILMSYKLILLRLLLSLLLVC